CFFFFFFQAEDGIRDFHVTGVQTCALPICSRRSRASSTPPCEAASISITSMLPGPSGASATHESHCPHGSGVGPCSQLSERARIRALDVLPQPRGPLNR